MYFGPARNCKTVFTKLEIAVDSVPFGSDAKVDPNEITPLTLQRAAESAPVIDLIEQLVDDSVPVWSPLLFDGFQTLVARHSKHAVTIQTAGE